VISHFLLNPYFVLHPPTDPSLCITHTFTCVHITLHHTRFFLLLPVHRPPPCAYISLCITPLVFFTPHSLHHTPVFLLITLCITPLSSFSSLCQSQLRELRGLQLVPKERKNAVWVRSVNVKIKVNGKDCSGKSVKEMTSFVLGRCG
jgi:hypothetical protein